MKPHLFIISSVVFQALAALCLGQDSSVQLRAILHNPRGPEVRFFVGKVGSALFPLNLAEEGLTDSQKVPVENGNFNIFNTATPDPKNPQASVVATVKIPEGASSVIAIIVPGTQSGPAYRMIAVSDDPRSFPWGESRAINLTPVDFALEVGDQKLLLPGGKITPVPKVTKLDEYNRAQTNFYYKEGEQWVIASERQMQFVNSLRRLFLIYKTPSALAPDVRTILDQAPPVLEKAR